MERTGKKEKVQRSRKGGKVFFRPGKRDEQWGKGPKGKLKKAEGFAEKIRSAVLEWGFCHDLRKNASGPGG